MKIRIIDFEATSVDPDKCLPLECAAVTYDTKTRKRSDVFSSLIWRPKYPPIPEEITELTGISEATMEEEGYLSPREFLKAFLPLVIGIDYLSAYNADYDRRVLTAMCVAEGQDILKHSWYCGMSDHPYPDRLMRCRQLQHRALDLGLLMDNRVKHRAMADVETMCDIFDLYDMDEVLAYHKVPWAHVAAIVPPPWKDNGVGRDQAKAAGFGWEQAPGCQLKFKTKWVARFKEGAELPKFPFSTELLT